MDNKLNSGVLFRNTKKQSEKHPFITFIRQNLGAVCMTEFRFHPVRRWRADYCINPVTDKIIVEVEGGAWTLIVEVEGGAWTLGRHTRGAGFVADMEKYNEATRLGYRVIRVTPDDLLSAKTLNLIKDLINAK